MQSVTAALSDVQIMTASEGGISKTAATSAGGATRAPCCPMQEEAAGREGATTATGRAGVTAERRAREQNLQWRIVQRRGSSPRRLSFVQCLLYADTAAATLLSW